MEKKAFQKIFTEITKVTKATCSVLAKGVGNEELAYIDGRAAQVIQINGEEVTLQVFQGTDGLANNAEVIFTGAPPQLKISDLLTGRILNAFGEAIDDGGPLSGKPVNTTGQNVNPVQRAKPSQFIATGIAGIDLNNTLVTGQKIPFFTDSGQPYNKILADVALKSQADKIILGGMGLSYDDYLYFRNTFKKAGVLDKILLFVNTSEDPPLERLLIPDMACTAANHFAYEKEEKVLVLLTDMTLYADALAIVANKMDQIPSKDSMPGSLYSDLAKIYEKAVQYKHGGSVTIIAVTTLNQGDITHAIPDNTGYITEGQLFLKYDTTISKIIIDPFRSLSRLKQNVIGKVTREDHPQVMNALVRLYADAQYATTKKENGFDISEYDQRCLDFARDYAHDLLAVDVNLPMDKILDHGWTLMARHFEKYEVGIKDQFVEKYWPQ